MDVRCWTNFLGVRVRNIWQEQRFWVVKLEQEFGLGEKTGS